MSKLLEKPYFLTEISKQFHINEWIKLRTICRSFNASFSLEHHHHTKRHCLWTQELFEEAYENKKILILSQICPLTPNVDPAVNDNAAIRWGCSNGNIEIVKYLISLKKEFPKINPAADKNLAIRWASKNGHLEIVKYLVSLKNQFPGIDPAADKNLAIRWASRNGHLEVVKYLVSLKKDFPGIDPAANNNEAIRFASRYGHLEVRDYLISLMNKFRKWKE